MYCEIVENLYCNGALKEVPNISGAVTTLKVQANLGSLSGISYKIQGKLQSDMGWSDITLIKDSSFDVVTENVTDTNVYTADITGYSSIKTTCTATGTANSNSKILAKIYGER